MSYKIPPPPPLPSNSTFKNSKIICSTNNISPLINWSLYNKYFIVELKPISQTGPNCGLAALAMAATITPCSLKLTDFCDQAKLLGFSNNGEMFSVRNMAILADTLLSPWFHIEMFSGKLGDYKALIVNGLQQGDLFLVPYDADKNNYPCCKKGHKAHWAILCGVLEGNDGCIYIAARQGKSHHLAVWSYIDLQASNDNLQELDPDREQDGNEYIIPCGGVREGLAEKFIHLHRR